MSMRKGLKQPTHYFYINGYLFNVLNDSKSDSDIEISKTKMFVSNKSYGYTDIQWNNFTGENIDLTILSRTTDVYTGEHAQPAEGGIPDFYNYSHTPAGVLKYWAQNFVPWNIVTNIQAHESAAYVVDQDGFSQENPTPTETLTHVKLIQYEKPYEMEQTYFQNETATTNSVELSAAAQEVGVLGELKQTCHCNINTPSDKCTASVNEQVELIQKYLQQWGYFPFYLRKTGVITTNGKFCYYTTQALKKFQEDNKLTVNGVFNKETREKFIKKLGE